MFACEILLDVGMCDSKGDFGIDISVWQGSVEYISLALEEDTVWTVVVLDERQLFWSYVRVLFEILEIRN